jgi:Fur family transcriptional regulator, ferric uptake regulator
VAAPKNLPCGRPAPASHSPVAPQQDLERALERLRAYCTEQSLNRTEAREKILETIVREGRHFTALDLLDSVGKRHPEVGKATVYRTLPVLVASGLIDEGPTDPEGNVLYELSGDEHHDHIVCLDCRRIFEFHDETIEKRQERVTSDLRFSVQGHRHVIYAACEFKAAGRKKA